MDDPETKQLFQMLANRPEFVKWLNDRQEQKIDVLKKNPNHVQLAQAQGAMQLIDEMRELMKRPQ